MEFLRLPAAGEGALVQPDHKARPNGRGPPHIDALQPSPGSAAEGPGGADSSGSSSSEYSYEGAGVYDDLAPSEGESGWEATEGTESSRTVLRARRYQAAAQLTSVGEPAQPPAPAQSPAPPPDAPGDEVAFLLLCKGLSEARATSCSPVQADDEQPKENEDTSGARVEQPPASHLPRLPVVGSSSCRVGRPARSLQPPGRAGDSGLPPVRSPRASLSQPPAARPAHSPSCGPSRSPAGGSSPALEPAEPAAGSGPHSLSFRARRYSEQHHADSLSPAPLLAPRPPASTSSSPALRPASPAHFSPPLVPHPPAAPPHAAAVASALAAAAVGEPPDGAGGHAAVPLPPSQLLATIRELAGSTRRLSTSHRPPPASAHNTNWA